MDRSRLVYDWNRAAGEGRPRARARRARGRDAPGRPAVAVGRGPDRRPALRARVPHGAPRGGHRGARAFQPRARTARAEGEALARLVTEARLSLQPGFAARTLPADIEPVVEIAQRVGRTLEMTTFIGSSPIRQYVEDWDLSQMMKLTRDAVTMGVREGPPRHVRHRGHDARAARGPRRALRHRDPGRRDADLRLRHRRARDAGRRGERSSASWRSSSRARTRT